MEKLINNLLLKTYIMVYNDGVKIHLRHKICGLRCVAASQVILSYICHNIGFIFWKNFYPPYVFVDVWVESGMVQLFIK